MILRFILWSIVLTLVLRFIVRIVFPVFNMTRMAQDRLAQMQKQMQDMQQQQQSKQQPTPSKPRHIDGDYIDYEEVK